MDIVRKEPVIILLLICFFSLLVVPGNSGAQDGDDFMGSKTCGTCHPTQKKVFLEHGHASMLRPVEGGTFPEGAAVQVPEGYDGASITYLIGGANNYARFTDSKGYVITGPGAQWSLDGKTLTPFKPDIEAGTLTYACIKCHTVGWKESGTYARGVQNELKGIPGTWFENGVGCEACHGPGRKHVALNKKRDIKKEGGDLKIVSHRESDMCGTCHTRTDNNNIIVVADDLIMNYQQYSELMRSRKAKFKISCVSCHNPHATSKGGVGITSRCADCHMGKNKKNVKIRAMADLACTDCHMPLAARGAYDTMVTGYHRGDIHSHMFGISVDPDYRLNDGSGHVSLTKEGFARLTVEMTCYACHKSGVAHDMPREEMLDMAKRIH